MKVEQACRFRTDDVGYQICARSPGITANHDRELSFFNSTMTALFRQDASVPRMGQSILSCVCSQEEGAEGQFFILARSTMRTDIKGRPSIFTHARFLELEAYRRWAAQEPGGVFCLSPEPMLTGQTGESRLDTLESDTLPQQPLSLAELRQRYQLDDDRYGKLLRLACQAITEGGCLCLLTEKPLEETETLVREIAFCIAQGLLPDLRWKLTCCSAGDSRTTLCVSSRQGGKMLGLADYEYDLDTHSPAVPEDAFLDTFFRQVASLEDSAREALLRQVQQSLEGLLPASRASAEMIAAFWHKLTGSALSPEDRSRVMMNLLLCARLPEADPAALEQALLETLAGWPMQEQPLPEKMLRQLLERYYQAPADSAYRQGLCSLLNLSDEEARMLLQEDAPQLLRPENAPMLQQLLSIRQERPLEESLALTLAGGILRQSMDALAEPCMALTEQLSGPSCRRLAGELLENARGRALTSMEQDVLNSLLGLLLERGGADRLDLATETLLDAHFAEYNESLLDTCTAYTLRLRLADESEEALALLSRLDREQPRWLELLRQALLNQCPESRLWSRWQCRKLLEGCHSYDRLLWACQSYDGPRHSMDLFEQQCAALWVSLFTRTLEGADSMKTLSDRLSQMEQPLKEAALSLTIQEQIREDCAGAVVEAASCRMLLFEFALMNSREQVMHLLQALPQRIQNGFRGILLETVSRFWSDPEDASPVLRLTDQPTLPVKEREELRELLFPLAAQLEREKGILSWDLLLASCYVREDAQGHYDCPALLRRMKERGGFALDTRPSLELEHSRLLAEGEPLRAELRKAAARCGDLPGNDRLAQALKPLREESILTSFRDKMSAALKKGLEKGRRE